MCRTDLGQSNPRGGRLRLRERRGPGHRRREGPHRHRDALSRGRTGAASGSDGAPGPLRCVRRGGRGTVWVLDSRQRAWTPIPVPDAVATNTAGDGTVLILRRDGSLQCLRRPHSCRDGADTLIAGGVPAEGPQPVVDLDSDRAYVNNAAGKEIYEIDYARWLADRSHPAHRGRTGTDGRGRPVTRRAVALVAALVTASWPPPAAAGPAVAAARSW